MKLRYSEFKDQIDIDQFESAIGFTVLSQSRGNDIGYCVFPGNHANGDTTGKFAIHRDHKVYNCFVCGGGSLLSLAMELHDLDVDEATTWLYQFTQDVDARSDRAFCDYLLELLDDVKERVNTMPYFNERVLERFGGPVEYFRTRNITDDVIERYNLCYGGSVLKPAPIKQRDGVPTKIDDDYLGPAAIFPHYWQGKLVGWQHRWVNWGVDTPKWVAKYTNTTDFPKSNTLFNYDHALRTEGPVMVVESVPTVLYLVSMGFSAVSYFGDAPTDAQLRLLRRFPSIFLCPDNDANGDRLLNSATPYLERYTTVWHVGKVIQHGPKADLGDILDRSELVTHIKETAQKVGVDI